MIAVWMIYSLVAGALIALVGWLMERSAIVQRISTRGVWIAAMLATIAATVFNIAPRNFPTAASERAAEEVSAQFDAVPSPANAERTSEPLVASRPFAPILRAINESAGITAQTLGRFDNQILIAWALLSAFFAGIAVRAISESKRLTASLEKREVGGSSVLITDVVCPSVVGLRSPAILIPRWVLDLDATLAALLVRHEREHITARDPWLLRAGLLMVVLLPWHLPLWWCWTRLKLAVEVDCDARVLRAHPDVRSYGRLLLFATQAANAPARAGQPLVSVMTPFQPVASHLSHRIQAMTQQIQPRPLVRTSAFVFAAVACVAALFTVPTPARAVAQANASRTIVRIGSVGVIAPTPEFEILIHSPGSAAVGVGNAALRQITAKDTIRLNSLPGLTLDVTDADVHVEIVKSGMIHLEGDVKNGVSTHLGATGSHIVFMKGGVGVTGPDLQSPK